MTNKLPSRQAGFTLVELLLVTAILAGLVLPAVENLRLSAQGLTSFRRLKAIGDDAERLRGGYEHAARAFLHFAGRDSTDSPDTPDAVSTDSLRTFCSAEATMQKVRERAEALLKITTSEKQRRVLTDFLETVDGEVVPVLRKMDNTLRTRAPGFCD